MSDQFFQGQPPQFQKGGPGGAPQFQPPGGPPGFSRPQDQPQFGGGGQPPSGGSNKGLWIAAGVVGVLLVFLVSIVVALSVLGGGDDDERSAGDSSSQQADSGSSGSSSSSGSGSGSGSSSGGKYWPGVKEAIAQRGEDPKGEWAGAPRPGELSKGSAETGDIDGTAIGVFRAEKSDIKESEHGKRFEIGVFDDDGAPTIEYITGSGLRSTDCDPGDQPVSKGGISFLNYNFDSTSRGGKSSMGARFGEESIDVKPAGPDALDVTFKFTTESQDDVCRGTVHFTAHRVESDGVITMWDAIVAATG